MIHPISRESVYSYRSADHAVRDFMIKRARVILFICKTTSIDVKSFRISSIKLFMYRNRSWNVFREVIKRLDTAEEMDYFVHLEWADRPKYLTFVKHMAEDWLIDHEKLV